MNDWLAPLRSETLNFRELALHCAKNFVGNKTPDQSLDPSPVPADLGELIKKALDNFTSVSEWTEEEAAARSEAAYAAAHEQYLARVRAIHELAGRCRELLKAVTSWDPPDCLISLKNFMVRELNGTIRDSDNDHLLRPPELVSGWVFKRRAFEEARQTLDKLQNEREAIKRNADDEARFIEFLELSLSEYENSVDATS